MTVAPLLEATHTVPIVFVVVIDQVGAGFVASLARPRGNATGFTMLEYGQSGKWLDLLRQISSTPPTRSSNFHSGPKRRLMLMLE
jgi:putative ABC transport system substrate-binding protein